MRKFTLKAGMDSGNSAYEYRYSLWLPMTGYAQPVSALVFIGSMDAFEWHDGESII